MAHSQRSSFAMERASLDANRNSLELFANLLQQQQTPVVEVGDQKLEAMCTQMSIPKTMIDRCLLLAACCLLLAACLRRSRVCPLQHIGWLTGSLAGACCSAPASYGDVLCPVELVTQSLKTSTAYSGPRIQVDMFVWAREGL